MVDSPTQTDNFESGAAASVSAASAAVISPAATAFCTRSHVIASVSRRVTRLSSAVSYSRSAGASACSADSDSRPAT